MINFKNNPKIIIAVIILVLAIGGGVFYFGWYRTPPQVVARCDSEWVEPEGDYYKARDNFYQCLESQGVEGFHGDGLFEWDR